MQFPEPQGPAQVEGKGCAPDTAYFETTIVFPVLFEDEEQELSDHEVLQLAESAGSFSFLDSSEEDIYSSSPDGIQQ
jgi:hypothetical protein